MKITKEDITEIGQLLAETEELRPIIRIVLDSIKRFGPEISEIPEMLSRWIVKNRIKSIAQYEEAGFSRTDAITMTLDEIFAIKRISQCINNTTKK